MDEMTLLRIVLAIIIGTLVAIAYGMRYLILLERRIGRIEYHTGAMVKKLFREELKIEKKMGFGKKAVKKSFSKKAKSKKRR